MLFVILNAESFSKPPTQRCFPKGEKKSPIFFTPSVRLSLFLPLFPHLWVLPSFTHLPHREDKKKEREREVQKFQVCCLFHRQTRQIVVRSCALFTINYFNAVSTLSEAQRWVWFDFVYGLWSVISSREVCGVRYGSPGPSLESRLALTVGERRGREGGGELWSERGQLFKFCFRGTLCPKKAPAMGASLTFYSPIPVDSLSACTIVWQCWALCVRSLKKNCVDKGNCHEVVATYTQKVLVFFFLLPGGNLARWVGFGGDAWKRCCIFLFLFASLQI